MYIYNPQNHPHFCYLRELEELATLGLCAPMAINQVPAAHFRHSTHSPGRRSPHHSPSIPTNLSQMPVAVFHLTSSQLIHLIA